MNKVNVNYKAKITDVQYNKENPSFYSGVVRIMTSNTMANNTYFTEESIVNAIPTLKNVPLVALYKEEEQAIGGHEVEYKVTKEDGLTVEFGTHPIGVVPESANVWFEDVVEKGVLKRYLCADVLLWKREKVYKLFKKKRSFGVSMEVQVEQAVLEGKVSKITQFYFTAIAVLGNEAPAFKSANIKVFSEESTFQDMMCDLKSYMTYSLNLGGENMKKDKLETIEEEVKVEPTEPQETKEEETPEVIVTEPTPSETYSDDNAKPNEEDEEKADEKEEAPSEEKTDSTESDESTDKLDEKLDEKSDEKSDEESKEEEEKEDTTHKQYSELKESYENLEKELSDKDAKCLELEAKIEALQVAHDELEIFKAEVLKEQQAKKVEELFRRFIHLADVDGFETLKAQANNFSLEELETQLFALVGKQVYSQKQSEPKKHNVALDSVRDDSPTTVFSILDKYL